MQFKVSHTPGTTFAAFMGKSARYRQSSAPWKSPGWSVTKGHDIVMYGKAGGRLHRHVRPHGFLVEERRPISKARRLSIPGWDTGTAQMATVLLKELVRAGHEEGFQGGDRPLARWALNSSPKGDVEMSSEPDPPFDPRSCGGAARSVRSWLRTPPSGPSRRGTKHHLAISSLHGLGESGSEIMGMQLGHRSGRGTEGVQYIHANTREWANRYRKYISKNATEAQISCFLKCV